jgi:myo-inositol-1-phosphate synthase
MRKCAMLEAGGTSAHDALLVSAGIRASEIEALRARANQLEEEMEERAERCERRKARTAADVVKLVPPKSDGGGAA